MENKTIYFEDETKTSKTSFAHFLKLMSTKAKKKPDNLWHFLFLRMSKKYEGSQSRGVAEAFQFPVLGKNEGPSDEQPAVRERSTHLFSI